MRGSVNPVWYVTCDLRATSHMRRACPMQLPAFGNLLNFADLVVPPSGPARASNTSSVNVVRRSLCVVNVIVCDVLLPVVAVVIEFALLL